MISDKEIDFVSKNYEKIIDTLCQFVLTDTILYLEESLDFGVRQKLVDTLDEVNRFLNTHYEITNDLCVKNVNVEQNEKLCEYLKSLEIYKLTVLYIGALKMRSVLLAVLLSEKRISSKEACNLSLFEAFEQQKKWGENSELLQKAKVLETELLKLQKDLL